MQVCQDETSPGTTVLLVSDKAHINALLLEGPRGSESLNKFLQVSPPQGLGDKDT